MNPNEYCNMEGDAFDYSAYAEMVGATNEPIAATAFELSNSIDPAIVYSTLAEINQAIPLSEIPVDQFTEHVQLEADSYAEDNYDDSDSFDSDEFSNVQNFRNKGYELMTAANRAMLKVDRKAKLSGVTPETVLYNVVSNSPETIMAMRRYLIDRGYHPDSTTEGLAAQFAHARQEHIGEVVSNYDADNFSFRSEKRRKARQARRLQRIADRIARRKARKQGRLDVRAMGDEPEEAQAETQQEAAAITPADTVSNPTSLPDTDSLNPTSQQAEAQILGEEFDGNYWGDSYEGDAENFLPFLAGAFRLGKSVLGDLSEGKNPLSKGNIEQARDLFRKKGKKKLKYDIAGGVKGIAKRESDDVMKKIEAQKTKAAIKGYMPVILVAVVALLVLGNSVK